MKDPQNKPKERKLNTFQKITLIVVLLLAGFLLLIIISEMKNGGSYPDSRDAKIMGRHFLEKRLKAPATAEYPGTSTDEVIIPLGDNKYSYQSYVDAENSFGAKIRIHFKIILKYGGNNMWKLKSIDTW